MANTSTAREPFTLPLTADERHELRHAIDEARREFNRRRYTFDFAEEVEAALDAYNNPRKHSKQEVTA